MNSLLFALNATLPVFFVILLGWFLQRIHLLDDGFNRTANRYVFQCALPVSLFQSISQMDLYTDFDLGFCIFCFLVTTVMFFATWGLSSLFLRNKGLVGAFSQSAARSSAAIFGIAFATNIYGEAGMVPMMIVAAVPFFNIYSVLILTFSPHVDEEGHCLPPETNGAGKVGQACRNVIRNPIILGILTGIPFALLRIQLPQLLDTTLDMVGATATPIALLVVGASLAGSQGKSRWAAATGAMLVKLMLLPALFLPLAALIGFRDSELVAILIMLGSPTTVSSYIMAKSMGGDGPLTANAIVLSTLFASLSITLWLFLLRSFALI